MAQLDRALDRYDLKTLEAALARRRARDKQLGAVRAKMATLEAELAKLDAAIGTGSSTRVGPRGGTVVHHRPNARRLNEISLADALEKVLRAAKKPVHYKQLTETVVKRGIYKTKSKNLLSTVAVTLKRDGRFKKEEAGIWALKK
ncbi:MAG: winged helix-turn-helix domain-containing protein [bacterium]